MRASATAPAWATCCTCSSSRREQRPATAIRSGEESGKRGRGAQGQRIVIHPRFDLTRRGLSPGGLVVARTLQQHGCYIGDNSGSATAITAEQASRRRDPWKGLLHQNSLKGITWNDFVVLPRGWQ